MFSLFFLATPIGIRDAGSVLSSSAAAAIRYGTFICYKWIVCIFANGSIQNTATQYQYVLVLVVVLNATLVCPVIFLCIYISLYLRPNLTSQTVTFYKRVDQSEIRETKRVFVSTPKLYKHDPVFGCVCLRDKLNQTQGRVCTR